METLCLLNENKESIHLVRKNKIASPDFVGIAMTAQLSLRIAESDEVPKAFRIAGQCDDLRKERLLQDETVRNDCPLLSLREA